MNLLSRSSGRLCTCWQHPQLQSSPDGFATVLKRFLRGSRSDPGNPPPLHSSLETKLVKVGEQRLQSRPQDLVAGSKEKKDKKWQLWGAICLERSPVVSAQRTPMEQDYWDSLQRQEFEKSLFSDFEIQKFQEVEKAKQKEVSLDEEAVVQTVQDREDMWNDLFEKFKPASRTTDADEKNDQTSLNRKLDRKLYLVVNQLLGSSPKWVFPQVSWQSNEKLKETAERALATACGTETKFQSFGGVPVGFYSYRYPADSNLSKEYYGAKVFFFKALLLQGAISPDSKLIKDYKWVTREELQDLVYEKYFERVERFMFEFNPGNLPKNPSHDDYVQMRF